MFADILPVGSKPAGEGRYTHRDLAGSVWEWALDWLQGYPSVSMTNYARLDSGTLRVLRGGAWNVSSDYLGAAVRDGLAPAQRSHIGGFRCARTP
jgi:formylglycine-generating enzyme required for sulfatase activity